MPKKFTRNDFRRALRKVRTKLLNGKITKEQFDIDTLIETDPAAKKPLCGTVACIGGHMAIEMDPRVIFRDRAEQKGKRVSGKCAYDVMESAWCEMPNLQALFYLYPGTRVTRARAAAAIKRALDGAEDPWKVARR